MKVKRFVAADMRRALELVKQEMGPDAIILSTSRSKGEVEVLTSCQIPDQWEPHPPKKAVEPTQSQLTDTQNDADALPLQSDSALGFETPVGRLLQKHFQQSPVADSSVAVEELLIDQLPGEYDDHCAIKEAGESSELEALKLEIADMRELLQTQLERLATNSATASGQVVSSVGATLNRRLRNLGLPLEDCDKLLAATDPHASLADSWNEALARFARQLPVTDSDIVDRGGFFAFVGAAGAGKTTTLSKLAARYVLKHGAGGVALVSTDSAHGGAREQLQRLGKILSVEVHGLQDCKNLPYLLRDLCNYSLVLVDTAGLSHNDRHLQAQLAILRNTEALQSLLVLAANTQGRMLEACVEAYQAAGLNSCVLTKLDDTSCLGETLSVVMQRSLTVAYTTNGQDLCRDIAVARAHQLVARAVALLKDENQKQKLQLIRQRGRVAHS